MAVRIPPLVILAFVVLLAGTEPPLYDIALSRSNPGSALQAWSSSLRSSDYSSNFSSGLANGLHSGLCLGYSAPVLQCAIAHGVIGGPSNRPLPMQDFSGCASKTWSQRFATSQGRPKLMLVPCPLPFLFFNGSCGIDGTCIDVHAIDDKSRIQVGPRDRVPPVCVGFEASEAVLVDCNSTHASHAKLSPETLQILVPSATDTGGNWSGTPVPLLAAVPKSLPEDAEHALLDFAFLHACEAAIPWASAALSLLTIASIAIQWIWAVVWPPNASANDKRSSRQLSVLNITAAFAIVSFMARMVHAFATVTTANSGIGFQLGMETATAALADVIQLIAQVVEVLLQTVHFNTVLGGRRYIIPSHSTFALQVVVMAANAFHCGQDILAKHHMSVGVYHISYLEVYGPVVAWFVSSLLQPLTIAFRMLVLVHGYDCMVQSGHRMMREMSVKLVTGSERSRGGRDGDYGGFEAGGERHCEAWGGGVEESKDWSSDEEESKEGSSDEEFKDGSRFSQLVTETILLRPTWSHVLSHKAAQNLPWKRRREGEGVCVDKTSSDRRRSSTFSRPLLSSGSPSCRLLSSMDSSGTAAPVDEATITSQTRAGQGASVTSLAPSSNPDAPASEQLMSDAGLAEGGGGRPDGQQAMASPEQYVDSDLFSQVLQTLAVVLAFCLTAVRLLFASPTLELLQWDWLAADYVVVLIVVSIVVLLTGDIVRCYGLTWGQLKKYARREKVFSTLTIAAALWAVFVVIFYSMILIFPRRYAIAPDRLHEVATHAIVSSIGTLFMILASVIALASLERGMETGYRRASPHSRDPALLLQFIMVGFFVRLLLTDSDASPEGILLMSVGTWCPYQLFSIPTTLCTTLLLPLSIGMFFYVVLGLQHHAGRMYGPQIGALRRKEQ